MSLDGNIVGYAGYLFDGELSPPRYTVRHRSYAPDLGRWLQRDPLGYVDGSNLYQYARSTPHGLTDPSGLNPGIDARVRGMQQLLGQTPMPSESAAMSSLFTGADGSFDASRALDSAQLALDMLGMTPVAGVPADIAIGLLSALRGDWEGVALSAAGICAGGRTWPGSRQVRKRD